MKSLAYTRTGKNRAVHNNPALAALQLRFGITPMEAEILWALYSSGPKTVIELTDITSSLSVGLKDRSESVRTVMRNLRKKLRIQNLPARYILSPEAAKAVAIFEVERDHVNSIPEAVLELRSLYSI